MPYIYKISNSVNDKVYIGQTIKSLRMRMTEHIYICNHPKHDHGSILHKAMRKYGYENFAIEAVEKCAVEELDDRERYWIQYYDSVYHGYNTTFGGQGEPRVDRQKILKCWDRGMSVSDISQETHHMCKAITNALLATGINEEEIKRRGYETISKKVPKPIYQYDLDGNFIAEFKSYKDAEAKTGVNWRCIIGATTLEHPTAGNFQWRKYKAENIGKSARVVDSTRKPVHQYTLDGEYVASHRSICQASKSVGLKSCLPIRRVCNGVSRTSAGFRWSFEKVDKLPPIQDGKRFKK